MKDRHDYVGMVRSNYNGGHEITIPASTIGVMDLEAGEEVLVLLRRKNPKTIKNDE